MTTTKLKFRKLSRFQTQKVLSSAPTHGVVFGIKSGLKKLKTGESLKLDQKEWTLKSHPQQYLTALIGKYKLPCRLKRTDSVILLIKTKSKH